MLKIHSKHIVEYKTCWFEKNLGSVADALTGVITDVSSVNTQVTNVEAKVEDETGTDSWNLSLDKMGESEMTIDYTGVCGY